MKEETKKEGAKPSATALAVEGGSVCDASRQPSSLVDKHVDPARYYRCRIKDQGVDRTPKPLLTDFRPGYSIYSVYTNPDDFGKSSAAHSNILGDATSKMNSLVPSAISIGRVGSVPTGGSAGTGNLPANLPAPSNLLPGNQLKQSKFGNQLGFGSRMGSRTPSVSGLSGVRIMPKASGINPQGSSKDLEMDKGLSDLAMEMGTMRRQPLVKWYEEARRLSVREKREMAKGSRDLTVVLTDTRLEIVYERLPSAKIVEDEGELVENAKKNKIYEDFLVFRAGNENFINKASQTINDAPKTKHTQTQWTPENSYNNQTSIWEIHDTLEEISDAIKKNATEDAEKSNPIELQGNVSTNHEGQMNTNREVNVDEATATDSVALQDIPEDKEVQIGSNSGSSGVSECTVKRSPRGDAPFLRSPAFKNHLFMMERVLNMNTHQENIGIFKGFYPGEKVETPSLKSQVSKKSHLTRLWVWNATGLTDAKPVTCMKWNKANKHLLAAGYGTIGQEGLICGWNLKNLEYPERFYKRQSAVLSVSFSAVLPSFLSCGSADGTVCVYNVKEVENVTILDSLNNAAHGHVSPVWQVGWVERDTSTTSIGLPERLVSIASDGRVADWKINKGFDATDMMRLKRSAMKPGFNAQTSKSTQKTTDTCLSRTAGGMTFSFSHTNHMLYLVGTDEGLIHLCNTNYSEQYLETYWGHTGPVFRVEWSPFLEDCFLSCSGDWSIRLWRRGEQSSIINLFSGTKAYYFVTWSPHNASVFAALNESSLEIWNLSTSIMEPVLTKKPEGGERITSVIFSTISEDIILIGDSNGDISVCKMNNLEPTPRNHRDLLLATIQTVTSSDVDEQASNTNWDGFVDGTADGTGSFLGESKLDLIQIMERSPGEPEETELPDEGSRGSRRRGNGEIGSGESPRMRGGGGDATSLDWS